MSFSKTAEFVYEGDTGTAEGVTVTVTMMTVPARFSSIGIVGVGGSRVRACMSWLDTSSSSVYRSRM